MAALAGDRANPLDGFLHRRSNTRPRCGRIATARKQYILAG